MVRTQVLSGTRQPSLRDPLAQERSQPLRHEPGVQANAVIRRMDGIEKQVRIGRHDAGNVDKIQIPHIGKFPQDAILEGGN